MEMLILIGIQGSGKTTFYEQRFSQTHVRISLDLLRTRERERALLQSCLDAKKPVVIDNTNVFVQERSLYLAEGRRAGFRTAGYFFPTELRTALGRNRHRTDKKAIPVPGVIRTWKRLEQPTRAEPFDELFLVKLTPEKQFIVSEWNGASCQ